MTQTQLSGLAANIASKYVAENIVRKADVIRDVVRTHKLNLEDSLKPPIRIDHWESPSDSRRKPEQRAYRPQRKPVTIAIGFAYDGGLIFCADTKVAGVSKANESKIEHRRSDDGNFSVTFAISSDDSNFPKTAISSCWQYIRQMDFSSVAIEAVHHAIQESLGDFYRDHIYPHPDRNPKSLFFELLVGVWLRGEKHLYISHETVLTAIDQYECIGAGAYLAKYLIAQYRRANPLSNSLQDAALIARHAVQAAIDYDELCGGNPEVLIVRDSGEVAKSDPAIGYPQEHLIQGISDATWRMLHDLAHMENHWIEADSRIDRLSLEIRELDLMKWNF